MTENTVTAILKVFSCCFGLTCTGTSEGKVCLANRYYFGQFGSLGYVVGGFLVFWWLCNILLFFDLWLNHFRLDKSFFNLNLLVKWFDRHLLTFFLTFYLSALGF